tara:strand:- start:5103 stop:5261 length:159 start_codon:yes stop_codon:yes gene_type:complete
MSIDNHKMSDYELYKFYEKLYKNQQIKTGGSGYVRMMIHFHNYKIASNKQGV